MAKRTKRLTSQGEELEEIRINKFLSEAGVCSRREADNYIKEGKVKIDGVVAEMGSRVTKDSQVTFLDQLVKREEKLVLIAFNKPEGIVCTTDQSDPDNIIDYINYGMRIYPIGRLDKDSEGLILLTNDGNIVNKILRAENNHEKEYIVTLNKEITADFIKNMSSGVPVLGSVTNPCTVTPIDKYTFNIILTQGLNRQIRRMCEYLEYRVINLRRIRIMNIQLGRLKTGDFRNVTEREIEELNQSFQMQKSKAVTRKTETGDKEGNNQKIDARKEDKNKSDFKARTGDKSKTGYRTTDKNRTGDKRRTSDKNGTTDKNKTADRYSTSDKNRSSDKDRTADRYSTSDKNRTADRNSTSDKNRTSDRYNTSDKNRTSDRYSTSDKSRASDKNRTSDSSSNVTTGNTVNRTSDNRKDGFKERTFDKSKDRMNRTTDYKKDGDRKPGYKSTDTRKPGNKVADDRQMGTEEKTIGQKSINVRGSKIDNSYSTKSNQERYTDRRSGNPNSRRAKTADAFKNINRNNKTFK